MMNANTTSSAQCSLETVTAVSNAEAWDTGELNGAVDPAELGQADVVVVAGAVVELLGPLSGGLEVVVVVDGVVVVGGVVVDAFDPPLVLHAASSNTAQPTRTA
jgi:hypothetical protein